MRSRLLFLISPRNRVFLVFSRSQALLSHSQGLPGNAILEALPRVRNTHIHEAEPRFTRSQAEPRNEGIVLCCLLFVLCCLFFVNDQRSTINHQPTTIFFIFSRSQALPGNAILEALPRVKNTHIHEAEPRFTRSQAEPRNEKIVLCCLLFVVCCLLTTNEQQSTINNQPSTNNQQQSTINQQQSTINHQQSKKMVFPIDNFPYFWQNTLIKI